MTVAPELTGRLVWSTCAGVVLGSYRLLTRIGEGGAGHVYVAEHVKLGRVVAIKVLRPEAARRRKAVARFSREARIVARIRHRNIVRVEDLIEPRVGPPYIVMELLRGRSLRELVAERGALGSRDVIEIGIQICSALEASHGMGVLHRDLKPGNVYVCDDRSDEGWIKLLDFGIAKVCRAGSAAGEACDITAEGTILGTPGYMSPEQASCAATDERSDLYSLGATLYEACCGERAVSGATLGACVRAHLTEVPRPPRAIARGRDVAPALEAVILRCLAKRPEDRPASAAALRGELVAIRAALLEPLPDGPGLEARVAPPVPPRPKWKSWGLAAALAAGAATMRAPLPGRMPGVAGGIAWRAVPTVAVAIAMTLTATAAAGSRPTPPAVVVVPIAASPPRNRPGARARRARPPASAAPTSAPVMIDPARTVDPFAERR